MSQYENYEKVSLLYDEARVADGAEFIWNVVVSMLKKDPNQLKVLDAGCGTGNYSIEFLKNGLQDLTMIDASEGMLRKAQQKVQQYGDYVTFKQMILPELSFSDSLFDAVFFIQVFHHIDQPDTSNEKCLEQKDYPNMIATLKESYRILKDGGVLVIDLMFDENIESFWWTSLCPVACNLMKRLRIPKKVLIQALTDMEFKHFRVITYPSGCLQKPDVYKQIHKVGDPHWRSYLSQYKQIEKSGELQNLIDVIEKKHLDGTLQQFSEQLNENLKLYGHHTTVVAQK